MVFLRGFRGLPDGRTGMSLSVELKASVATGLDAVGKLRDSRCSTTGNNAWMCGSYIADNTLQEMEIARWRAAVTYELR